MLPPSGLFEVRNVSNFGPVRAAIRKAARVLRQTRCHAARSRDYGALRGELQGKSQNDQANHFAN